MNKFNLLILFLALSLLFTCNRAKPFSIDKENYSLEFGKVLNSKKHSNHIQTYPLNINAERISLKNLLAYVAKVDTSAIKFKDKEIGDKKYSVKIVQKNKDVKINTSIIQDIIKNLNLDLIKKQIKSYEMTISDTLRFNSNLSKLDNKHTIIKISTDSISVKNIKLSKFIDVINKEYSDYIFCTNNPLRIDYKWHKSTLVNLKQNLLKDLGLIMSDTKNDKFIYNFKEK